jgi:ketosteroid isomerase-like protein
MTAFIKMSFVLSLLGAVSCEAARAEPVGGGASDAEAIKQLEQGWGDAMIAVDLARLSEIVADDWISGSPGRAVTKAAFLEDVRSRKHKLEAFALGPRDVQVMGDVAVLQGSVTETRIVDGKRGVVRVTYMDVWVKRAGRWVVFRSHATKL